MVYFWPVECILTRRCNSVNILITRSWPWLLEYGNCFPSFSWWVVEKLVMFGEFQFYDLCQKTISSRDTVPLESSCYLNSIKSHAGVLRSCETMCVEKFVNYISARIIAWDIERTSMLTNSALMNNVSVCVYTVHIVRVYLYGIADFVYWKLYINSKLFNSRLPSTCYTV